MKSSSFKTALVGAISLAGWAAAAAVPAPVPALAHLMKRTLPNFSQWDMNKDKAQENKDKILAAWSDAIKIASRAHNEKGEPWQRIFDLYFNPGDKLNVGDVWQFFMGAKDAEDKGKDTGSDYFEGILMTLEPLPNYIENIVVDPPNRAVMRICDRAMDSPLLKDTTCEELGDEVSGKMSTLGGVIVHEVMHFDAIGKLATGVHIQDWGDDGYGPLNTRKFKSPSQVPQANADSYRWFAQELFWSIECKKEFKAPTSNKDYLTCKKDDEETSCVIQ